MRANHALQRTRRERRGCNRGVLRAGSLSLGRSGIEKTFMEASVREGVIRIETEMRRMLDGQSTPYEVALSIWGMSMSLVSLDNETTHAFWLIWGSLTDWVENRPEELTLAESKMRQARLSGSD